MNLRSGQAYLTWTWSTLSDHSRALRRASLRALTFGRYKGTRDASCMIASTVAITWRGLLRNNTVVYNENIIVHGNHHVHVAVPSSVEGFRKCELMMFAFVQEESFTLQIALFHTFGTTGVYVAAVRKRSHQFYVPLTPNNTKTIGRMTCHCFLRPIRRDLMSSSYTTLKLIKKTKTQLYFLFQVFLFLFLFPPSKNLFNVFVT